MTTQTHLTNMYGMSRDTCTGCPATTQPRIRRCEAWVRGEPHLWSL